MLCQARERIELLGRVYGKTAGPITSSRHRAYMYIGGDTTPIRSFLDARESPRTSPKGERGQIVTPFAATSS